MEELPWPGETKSRTLSVWAGPQAGRSILYESALLESEALYGVCQIHPAASNFKPQVGHEPITKAGLGDVWPLGRRPKRIDVKSLTRM